MQIKSALLLIGYFFFCLAAVTQIYVGEVLLAALIWGGALGILFGGTFFIFGTQAGLRIWLGCCGIALLFPGLIGFAQNGFNHWFGFLSGPMGFLGFTLLALAYDEK